MDRCLRVIRSVKNDGESLKGNREENEWWWGDVRKQRKVVNGPRKRAKGWWRCRLLKVNEKTLKSSADALNGEAKTLNGDGKVVNGDGKALNGYWKPIKGEEEALNCTKKALKGLKATKTHSCLLLPHLYSPLMPLCRLKTPSVAL